MKRSVAADHASRRVRECHEVLLEEALTHRIIGAFFDVYNVLGYGFLEAVYARALEVELGRRGLRVAREVSIDVSYAGETVGHYRADLVVEDSVVLELKAQRIRATADWAQLLNCLRASDMEVGLVLNFGPRPTFLRVVASNEMTSHLHGWRPRKLAVTSASFACATQKIVAVPPSSPQ